MIFVVELATRRVEIAGITPGTNEAWMMQVGKNLTDPVDGGASAVECLHRLGGMLRFYQRVAA